MKITVGANGLTCDRHIIHNFKGNLIVLIEYLSKFWIFYFWRYSAKTKKLQKFPTYFLHPATTFSFRLFKKFFKKIPYKNHAPYSAQITFRSTKKQNDLTQRFPKRAISPIGGDLKVVNGNFWKRERWNSQRGDCRYINFFTMTLNAFFSLLWKISFSTLKTIKTKKFFKLRLLHFPFLDKNFKPKVTEMCFKTFVPCISILSGNCRRSPDVDKILSRHEVHQSHWQIQVVLPQVGWAHKKYFE